jgi:uncharacterized membrane protein YdjX (TVP38/TMEM64 family)
MFKKIIPVLIIIAILLVGMSQKDVLIETIKHGGSPAIIISILLLSIGVFFPMVPFPVSAGMIGAGFGPIPGAVITLSGSMFGTILLFFTIRYSLREWAQKKLKRYPKIQEYEEYLNRKSFSAIFTARLIPVIPAPAVNIVCGLSKVSWKVFIIASAIGKIPYILVLTYAGANLHNNMWNSVFIYASYLLIMFTVNLIVVNRKNIKRVS